MGTFELEGVKIILGHLAFFSPNSAHQAKYVNIWASGAYDESTGAFDIENAKVIFGRCTFYKLGHNSKPAHPVKQTKIWASVA